MRTTLLFALMLALAGCGGGGGGTTPLAQSTGGGGPSDPPPPPPPDPRVRVIVGDYDDGINPYHLYFNACTALTAGPVTGRQCSPIYPEGSPPSSVMPEVLAELGIDAAHQMKLTRTGDYTADRAADTAIWQRIDAAAGGELFWFAGTNLIATSFAASGMPHLLTGSDSATHGIGTTGAVLAGNPEAIVLFAQEDPTPFPDALVTGGFAPKAESFLFRTPAIDIVTNSHSLRGAPPHLGHMKDSWAGVYENGKLHLNACNNEPVLAMMSNTCGPWWTVAVSGLEEGSTQGRQAMSSLFPDFVADFTQTLPYCSLCESGLNPETSGTSFATPLAAGIVSKIVLQARRALDHRGGIVKPAGERPLLAAGTLADGSAHAFTNWQLRRALEQSAIAPAPTDFSPNVGVEDVTSFPVPPGAPWSVIGWGLLSPLPERGLVPRTLVELGLAAGARTPKDPGYCEFQTAQLRARKAYWDNNPGSQTYQNVPSPDPFLFCP